MGYRIDYGQPSDKKYGGTTGNRRILPMVCGALLLFSLLTSRFWPEGKAALRELLIPGDANTTSQAFRGMVQDVREGERFMDAAAAFCREILDEAGSEN